MTIKRYLENAYVYNFDAIVEDVTTYNGKSAIVLKETYFYPEGGGQPSDQGQIGEIKIIDVQIDNDIIFHIYESPYEVKKGDAFVAMVDGERRFHFMQQHAGQHLLSGTAYNLFGAHTVGFHMGEDYITIDLDQVLEQKDIDEIEYVANKTIHKSLDIIAHMPQEDALREMPLRKTPKVTENIRVIEINAYDFSPCGGTHPKNTGEIGLIKIKRFERYKSGIRIEFICGLAAVKYVQRCVVQMNELMKRLAKPEFELTSGLDALLAKQKEERQLIAALEQEIITQEIAHVMSELEPIDGPHLIVLSENDYPLQRFRNKVSEWLKTEGMALIACNVLEGECHFMFGISKDLKDSVPVKSIFDAHKDKLALRGGGNDYLVQGKSTQYEGLDNFIEALEEAVRDYLITI